MGSPLSVKIGVHNDLEEARGHIVKCNSFVPFDTDLPLGGATLRFTRSGSRIQYQIRAEGEDEPARAKSLRLPSVLEFAAFGLDEYAVAVQEADGLVVFDRTMIDEPEYEPDDGVMISSAWGAKLPFKQGAAFLVDTDLNGKLGDETDGLMLPDTLTVAPWTGEVWFAEAAYRVTVDGDDFRVADVKMPKADADHSKSYRLMNWRRQQAGCPAVAYDADLEAGMHAHARYMDHNGIGHIQNSTAAGASEAGARAGANCVLGQQERSHLSAMQSMLATGYHRNQILDPGVGKTAIVVDNGWFLCWCGTLDGPFAARLLLYPPHGMEAVPVQFAGTGESPMPMNDDRPGAVVGTMISLTHIKLMPRSPAPACTVRAGSSTVRGEFHTPHDPPTHGNATSNFGNASFLPAAPLARRTKYEVEMVFGETTYRWWFVTE